MLQKREEEFNSYLRDKLADAKGDFRQLLKETHSLNYKYELATGLILFHRSSHPVNL